MTDKQIIEHKLLYEGLDWSVGVDGMFINPKQIPYTNCLYELALACDSKSKQLKAKEQECEELKEKVKKYGEINEQETKDYAELKAENEELKKCYKNNSALLDFEETNTTKLVNKVMKLEKTLAEIKGIAKNGCYDDCGMPLDELSIILQKISECEVNNG